MLGERPVVELVNTAPEGTGGAVDLLSDVDLAGRWLIAWAEANPDEPFPRVPRLSEAELESMVLLRGAVEQVLGGSPRPSSLAVVNRYDSEASPSWILSVDGSGRLGVGRRWWGDGVEALLGLVASDCIDLVRSGMAGDVRRCDAPTCGLRFVADHHRRRFCRPECSHRARQAAYHRRRLDDR